MKQIEYKKGQKIHNLIFLEDIEHTILSSGKKIRTAKFLCVCGSEFNSPIPDVKSKQTQSCGCYKRKLLLKKLITHGMTKTKLYKNWVDIKARCYNKNSKSYINYGGRGITIHESWKNNFELFREYVVKLENYNTPNYTLDRINNDKGYQPLNIRWASSITQARNKRKKKTNTSGFIGVSLDRYTWKACISVNKKIINIGYFNNKIDAAKARDQYIIDNNLTDFTMNNIIDRQ